MLEVVVDATPIAPKPSGVGYYVANLIHSLHTLQKTEDFCLGVAYQPGLKKMVKAGFIFSHGT